MIFSNMEKTIASRNKKNWLETGGNVVLQLQYMYPLARVVYTTEGLTQFRHVVGLCARLGLWHESLLIKTRLEFVKTLEQRLVHALLIVVLAFCHSCICFAVETLA